ncbi:MAG: imidazolonepropionase-like amidohydrolase [Candidatus Paceibacteria bacterium]|jgi:imidazolonepropionase-like amidohydrolase
MILNTILVALAMASPAELPVPITDAPAPVPTENGEAEENGVSKNEADPKNAGIITAFNASLVYLGDGTSLKNGTVLVKEGVIVKVGADLEIPSGAIVVKHDGALSAGLIASHSNDGVNGELTDGTRTVMPEAQAHYAFNPEHGDMKRALASGVTALVLAPSSTRLIGGQTAVVKTSGGTVVKSGAQLALGLSSEALSSNKFPTSYSGAQAALKSQFLDPKGAVSRAVNGSLPVMMEVGTRAEIQRALAFAKQFDLKGCLLGSYWAEDLVDAIQKSGLDVVCTPFGVGDNDRGARAAAGLAAKGVRIGFGLDSPARHPESLRLGAALCVRAGMPAGKARAALTGDAAAIAGVAGRIGAIKRGLDADIVLWSGDPIALTSSVQAVYVEGKLVFGGEK